jgi:phosphoribosyl-ATP pyrophosphohydrolase
LTKCRFLAYKVFNETEVTTVNLDTALTTAREKHPVFARSKREAASVVLEEAAELFAAALHEDDERFLSEAMDVLVTITRLMNKEYTDAEKD